MKLVKVLLGLLILIFLGAYFLKSYLTSGSPRNLGITYTEQDKTEAYAKNGVTVQTLAPVSDIKQSLRFEGKKDVKFSFNSSQITALNDSNNWQYSPVSHLQIKINPDNTGEVSGILHVNLLLPFISLTHSTAEVEKAMQKYNISANPPFYLKGTGSVINNKVTLNPTELQIGRITVPSSLVSPNLPVIEKFAQDRINAVPNLYVRSLNIQNGTVNFDGTMPEKEIKSVK